MTKFNTKKMLIIIGRNVRVLLTALKYITLSTLTIGLFAIAIAGFCVVGKESGYAAVFDFVGSCFTFVIAIASLYFLGNHGNKRGGKYVA